MQNRETSETVWRWIGEHGERLKAVEAWQAKWEHRGQRICLLIGLSLWALATNMAPKEIGEALGAAIGKLLIGS